MSIQNVTLVGATGNLGTVLLQTLLAANPPFNVTVLRRASSTSVLAAQPHSIVTVPDDWTTEALTTAIRDSKADAVIAAFPLRNVDDHLRLADAAAAAGCVRRFIPADYGSVDARSQRARDLVALFERKVTVRERLEAHAAASEQDTKPGNVRFTWTSLVNGHFFDWGLTNGFLHFYPAERRAEILGDGNARSSNATLGRVAEAVVAVLRRLEETANRVLMVQSFCVSQNEVLAAVERATAEKWKVEYRDTEEFIREKKALADGGDKEAIEDLVFALGVVEGNWEVKEDFAMGLLGLENEDLDEVVRRALGVDGEVGGLRSVKVLPRLK